MKVGDLVKITRISILASPLRPLLPIGSVGLILRRFDQKHIQGGYTLFDVDFGKHSSRRVLDKDLEVINASR